MRRPRLRLWQVMLAVAIVAILTFAARMRRQWNICRERVAYYAKLERTARNNLLGFEKQLSRYQAALEKVRREVKDCEPDQRQYYNSMVDILEVSVKEQEYIIRSANETIDDFSRMRAKWEQAAAHPWVNVPTDRIP
jgi:hypothetical protein